MARGRVRATARRRDTAALALFLLLPGCAATAGPATPSPHADPLAPADRAWVEATLDGMDLPHKVAQLIFPRVSGAYLPVGSVEYARVRRWVAELGVGGLIATLGPPLEAAVKFNMLQRLADVPLLVAADMEHGPGQLMNGGAVMPWGLENGGGTRFPPAMGVGATDDERLAYELGRVTAIEARAAGVHLNFAPVVDVNNDPANPIINTRSFGADPQLVARLAAAQVRGMQEHGLLAPAKHFPGHGDTGMDSHIELPFIDVSRARADSVELVPYRAVFQAGAAAVMSAHIAFPAIAGDSTPATLSPPLFTGLLRDDLGFAGIAVTDALDMGAIVNRYGPTEAPILALEAGADLLLQPRPDDVPGIIAAITHAVQGGRVSPARIDASVRRLLEAKAALGLHRERTVPIERIPELVARPDHIELAAVAATRSITLVRDRDGVLPLRDRRLVLVQYRDDVDPLGGRAFAAGLSIANHIVGTYTLGPDADPRVIAAVRSALDSADVAVFGLSVRVGEHKADLSLPVAVATLVEDAARVRPVIAVSFGNPYVLAQMPSAGAYLLAWAAWPPQQQAAARALTGTASITGRLPIPLPPLHAPGDGIEAHEEPRTAAPERSFPRSRPLPPEEGPERAGMDARLGTIVDSIVATALAEGAAPGVAVVVGRHGRLVHRRNYGVTDASPAGVPVTDSTIWDMASLTKVVATTTLAMLLVQEGRLDPDARLSRYLPAWPDTGWQREVTVRHLLRHDGGFVAYGPLWREARGRSAYVRRITGMPLEYAPGTRTVYSDYGIILLGRVIEQVGGAPLDALAYERIFAPLGMTDTGYRPREWASPVRIAPTEIDTVFRMRHVHGDVHDENAFALGGVAGHAGLFSSARDMAVFAQMLLGGGEIAGRRLLDDGIVRTFTTRQGEGSSRALGWDTPAPGSSAGDWFTARSFGHTGFTGTSLWVDPERDLFLVILSNRVNPTRDNQRHVALRRDLADAVQRAIRDQPVAPRPGAR